MTTANRVAITEVAEVTLGVTPVTPRMRTVRYTTESLEFKPDYLDSDEIRSDGMNVDPILVMSASLGGLNGEFSFPVDLSPDSNRIQSALRSPWVNTPFRDNDGIADSVITDIQSGTQVVTCTTGAAFVTGQLVKFSGLAAAASNVVQKCTTGSATVPAFVGGTLVTDATPAAAARMKVVGFQGVAGDITATATGLGSTALNFTLMGLTVGQWVKIGGTAVGDQFATALLNTYARITAIAATALTLDNLPVGWGVDAGAGKTIKVWFGDLIKNGVTVYGRTLEKGFLGQTAPTYIKYLGMVVNTMNFTFASRDKVKWDCTFMGLTGTQNQVTLDASPDVATSNAIMASHANVGRIGEAGAALSGANRVNEITFSINNNLRAYEAIDSTSPFDIQLGEFTQNGRANTYFGDNTLLAKFYAGTPTALNARVFKNSQACIFESPRVTYREDGNPKVQGKNTDVFAAFGYTASIDTLTNSQMIINRMEYLEATN